MRTLILALILKLCCGCSGQVARVRGVGPLNVNSENESTPVDVRLYQLRSDGAFSRAGFAALWTDPVATLGHDLIGQPTVATILPGTATDPAQLVQLPDAETAWVGVQLLVRHEGPMPRTLLIPADRLAVSVIEATGYGLRLAEGR